MNAAMIELKRARIGYGSEVLFDDLDLTVYPGQWTTLLGPNGSGKTTLLRALLGVLPLLDGKRICHAKRVAYVPQRFAVAPDTALTLAEFLDLNPDTREGQARATKRVALLRGLGLTELLERPLRILSGGQLQKALLAFGLWGDPDVLFLDEYTEGIDVAGRQVLLDFFEKLKERGEHTIVEVSHDLSAVNRFSHRVILLGKGILYDGPPRDKGFHECLHQAYGDSSVFHEH